MKTNDLLNMILSSGQELLKKGQAAGESTLGIPAEGASRDAALSNLGKGALAGGLLSLLVGTKTGRNITGKAAAIGSVAALATVAYSAYQKYQQAQASNPKIESLSSFTPEAQSETQQDTNAQALLQAIIAGAKADGHVDDKEREMISSYTAKLDDNLEAAKFVEAELAKPLDPNDFAKYAADPALASQIYLLSVIVTEKSNFMENAYLAELAKVLNLNVKLIIELEAQLK